MRNPYKPRQDYTRVFTWGIVGLALLALALVAIYVLRPTTSAAQHREEILIEQQMDQAEIVAAKKERDRRAALLSDSGT